MSLAVRALRQDRVGADLAAPLRDDETAWLDADSGDVVGLGLGAPPRRAARLRHPAVLVTSQRILDVTSAAQCQHLCAVSATRITGIRGNVGTATLAQLRETIAVILDLP